VPALPPVSLPVGKSAGPSPTLDEIWATIQQSKQTSDPVQYLKNMSHGLRVRAKAARRLIFQRFGGDWSEQLVAAARKGDQKKMCIALDRAIFAWLRISECRQVDTHAIGELIVQRAQLACRLGDRAFFMRLGRALEKPAMYDMEDMVQFDKLARFLVLYWTTPRKVGEPPLCQMSDYVVYRYCEWLLKRKTTLDRVRKVRQRLGLSRGNNSKPTITKIEIQGSKVWFF
jgi:hypothetical protein